MSQINIIYPYVLLCFASAAIVNYSTHFENLSFRAKRFHYSLSNFAA